jgi:hypothetical protein
MNRRGGELFRSLYYRAAFRDFVVLVSALFAHSNCPNSHVQPRLIESKSQLRTQKHQQKTRQPESSDEAI